MQPNQRRIASMFQSTPPRRGRLRDYISLSKNRKQARLREPGTITAKTIALDTMLTGNCILGSET